MSCEYRPGSDFPARGLPLCAWPDRSRVMMTMIGDGGLCGFYFDSTIVDKIETMSIISSSLTLDSEIVHILDINSRICPN